MKYASYHLSVKDLSLSEKAVSHGWRTDVLSYHMLKLILQI